MLQDAKTKVLSEVLRHRSTLQSGIRHHDAGYKKEMFHAQLHVY